jgi:arsenate reductase (thioredoxin)
LITKEKVLIICSKNSARSQMAEGFLRKYGNRYIDVFSAGFDPAPINPLAIKVMKEIGIDISGQRSKSVKEYLGKMSFGHVIAVCKKAEEQCPVIFPSALKVLSWPFDDPAAFSGTEAEKLQDFRRIRDEIDNTAQAWVAKIQQEIEPARKRVLFLCTHNSARSQIAECLMNTMMGDCYEAHSAGLEPGKLNPFVVRAMAEVDINIASNRTKGVDEFINQDFDFVVTVCDKAGEVCPWFPGAKETLHQGFPDPSTFTGTDKEIMERVRQVRDQIKEWIVETFPC